MAGTVISRALMLVAMILVARMLGKTVYGELGIINSTINMFGIFAGFGLGMTATKYVAEYRQSDPDRAGRIIGLSGIFTIASGGLIAFGLFIFAPWLAKHTINAPHLAGVLRISALILFISALNGAQTGALAGFEAFKTIAYVNLFVGIISFPILVIGAYFGGLTGTVWALAINLAVNWLINHLALRKEAHRYKVPFTLKNCTCEMPVLWRFSLPAVLAGAMVGPVSWACNALLVNRPNGYDEMGIFNAASQWQIAIVFIPSMISRVVLPMLSSLNAKSESQRYRKVLILNVTLNTGIALAIVLPLVLFAYFVMSAYGTGFERGTNVLRVLAVATVLMAVNGIVGQAITSKGKMWIGFMFNTLWAIALLAGTWILLYNGYGAFGMACATLIAYVLHTVWQSAYLWGLLRRE
jgi:O-antigen/teichoic acid export membrane protein